MHGSICLDITSQVTICFCYINSLWRYSSFCKNIFVYSTILWFLLKSKCQHWILCKVGIILTYYIKFCVDQDTTKSLKGSRGAGDNNRSQKSPTSPGEYHVARLNEFVRSNRRYYPRNSWNTPKNDIKLNGNKYCWPNIKNNIKLQWSWEG